jgi:hypothetical protein
MIANHKFSGTPLDKAYDSMCHMIRHGWDFADALKTAAQREGANPNDVSALWHAMRLADAVNIK